MEIEVALSVETEFEEVESGFGPLLAEEVRNGGAVSSNTRSEERGSG